jgi:hypothetical protein
MGSIMVRVWLIGSLLLAGAGQHAMALCGAASTPVGPGEFRVNCTTANDQLWPRVAAGADDGFIIVWESRELDGGDVVARRYAAGAVGPEILINTSLSTGSQQRPAIAARQAGYIVAFGSDHLTGPSVGQVYVRQLDANGSVLGLEDRVSQGSPPQASCDENTADVAADTDGSFLVAWSGRACTADPAAIDIFGRAYDASAMPRGAAFPFNAHVPEQQHVPRLLRIGTDRYAGVWRSLGQETTFPLTFDVFGHVVQSGSPLGGDFQVNETVDGSHDSGHLAPAAPGGFLAVWSKDSGSAGNGVYRRFFDDTGAPDGSELLIAAVPLARSAVAQGSTGGYLIVYEYPDGDGNGVYGQYLDPDGSVVGGPFAINETTTGEQGNDIAIAADSSGGFMVVWESDGEDGSGVGVYARYLSGPCGNALIEAGEQCDDGSANGTSDSCCDTNCTFRIDGTACAEDGDLCTDDVCNGSSSVCEHLTVTPCETVSATAGSGATITTDSELDGASAADAVETWVTTPNPGSVVIVERGVRKIPPTGFSFFGQQMTIVAPAATAANPLRVIFELDASLIPVGQNPTAISVFRNGAKVPTCTGGPGVAVPDPCLSNRAIEGDLDMRLTVLTSDASEWNLGVGCRVAEKSILVIRNHPSDDGKDKLLWKWVKGEAVNQAEIGDPTDSADYTLHIYLGTAATLLDMHVPADATKWSGINNGYKYDDPGRGADGIEKIILKGSANNTSKALLKGKGAGLPDPSLGSLPPPLRVQLTNDDTQLCLEATYDSADLIRNDVEKFKAKAR